MRVAPADSRLFTSDHPWRLRPWGSSVTDASPLTLSNTSCPRVPVKVKRNIAAWSVGVISVTMPSSKRTR